MKINPIALVFWAFLGGLGYLIGGPTGAIVGVVSGMGYSLVVTAINA